MRFWLAPEQTGMLPAERADAEADEPDVAEEHPAAL